MQQFLEGMGNTLILLYYGLPEVLFITAIVMLVYHAVRIIIAGINSAETVTEQMIRQVMTANAVQTFSILGALSSIAVMTG